MKRPLQWLALCPPHCIISRNWLQTSRIDNNVLLCVCLYPQGSQVWIYLLHWSALMPSAIPLMLIWIVFPIQFSCWMRVALGSRLCVCVCVLEQGLLKGLAICVMHLIMYFPLSDWSGSRDRYWGVMAYSICMSMNLICRTSDEINVLLAQTAELITKLISLIRSLISFLNIELGYRRPQAPLRISTQYRQWMTL